MQVPVEQVTRVTDGTVPSTQCTVLREGGVQLQLQFSFVHSTRVLVTQHSESGVLL